MHSLFHVPNGFARIRATRSVKQSSKCSKFLPPFHVIHNCLRRDVWVGTGGIGVKMIESYQSNYNYFLWSVLLG